MQAALTRRVADTITLLESHVCQDLIRGGLAFNKSRIEIPIQCSATPSFFTGGKILVLDREHRVCFYSEVADNAGASAFKTDRGIVNSRRNILDRKALVVIHGPVRVAFRQIDTEAFLASVGQPKGSNGFAGQIPEADGLLRRDYSTGGERDHPAQKDCSNNHSVAPNC